MPPLIAIRAVARPTSRSGQFVSSQSTRAPAIRIYDSATRTVRAFETGEAGKVGIYDCGPTVWGYQHIGNLYRYIVADVIRTAIPSLRARSCASTRSFCCSSTSANTSVTSTSSGAR